jgi:DNA topoisomerase I
MLEIAELELSHKELLKIDKDYEKAASIVHLVYVNDSQPGITRVKKGKGFAYFFRDEPVTNAKDIERIKKLVIPPAWENVWICALENGHLQATGFDAKHRKQYLYHALWQQLRNETKFHKLYEFGKALPKLRLRLEEDITQKELSQQKVLATIISLMERTYIRIGSADYEKLYGSYGITTLKDKHVNISGDKIIFSFTGKKGIQHNITLRNKKLAKIVKDCRNIPGKELFQYFDESGNRKAIDSGMVNDYIKEATGMDFTAKDLRTWSGTIHALQALWSLGESTTVTDCKKNIVSALDIVSKKLGNTRSVCKKYYVHPVLFELYQEKKLIKYMSELNQLEQPDDKSDLTAEEKILIKILKSYHSNSSNSNGSLQKIK